VRAIARPTRRLTLTTLLSLALACVLGAACNGQSEGGDGGSETHWLGRCSSSDQCAAGFCLCGVCTNSCIALDGCDGTLICASNQSPAYGKLCADVPMPPLGICLWPCDGDSCPEGNHCEGDACVPDPPPPPPQLCSGQDTSTCDLANAQAVCAKGICMIAACGPEYGHCDNLHQNGCETLIKSDIDNCGQCGNACDLLPWPNVATKTCQDFNCEIVSCEPGYEDCDGARANGCECDTAQNVCDGEECVPKP